MRKPGRFYVEWFGDDFDPDGDDDPVSTTQEVASLAEGKRLWEKVGGRVVERINITDTTPEDEPVRGICWDWQEEEVWS